MVEERFDELNSIKTKSVPYELYFSQMDLTDEQKEKRIEFSKKMEEIILFLFALIATYKEFNVEIVLYNFKKEFINRFDRLIEEYIEDSNLYEKYREDAINYLKNYENEFFDNFFDTTKRNIDDKYYLSNDRAILTAENEANTTINYIEYMNAVSSGKKSKKWIDIKDNKERETHREVGGEKIPINDYFYVGDSMMLFPKDTSMGASLSEIANCRCTIKYF